jgi:hypothetical protein
MLRHHDLSAQPRGLRGTEFAIIRRSPPDFARQAAMRQESNGWRFAFARSQHA